MIIPTRGEDGKSIRCAFIPETGWLYLAADYSQIELRLLAHFSDDVALIEAFHRGEDIHSRTASEIFQVKPQLVTPDMRRQAKVINFGIIYGMSSLWSF
ncbi:MAG: DNA polymerase I [Candidatus Methanoperedenaceae archaeon GB50]|nr:MAG: DNA polymerase I [Candidatus Methanoperedenaceae archaeon GB50]